MRQDSKGSDFYKAKLYYKALIILKTHAQDIKRATRKILFYFKKMRRRYLFDAMHLWEKILILPTPKYARKSREFDLPFNPHAS